MEQKAITQLLEKLVKKGVCKTGKRYLSTTKKDFDTLVKVWKGWPEYFCEHSQTIVEVLRSTLDGETKKALRAKNIFFDFKGDVKLDSDTAVFFVGNSKAEVELNTLAMVKIYLFNEAEVDITCRENSYANIEAYDTTKLQITNESFITSAVYSYDRSEVEIAGKANLFNKEYKRGQIFNGKEII